MFRYQEKTKIRQYGVQGINIKPLVESVTKYFITVDDPSKIQYYMEKAYHFATSGRPGPVWIDVPLDVQKMEVPTKLLEEFAVPSDDFNLKLLKQNVAKTLELLSNAKRPIFLVGQGVRLAKAADDFNKIITKLKIPVLTSRLGIDLIESDNELYVGRPGNYGERAANFAIQNSDLIIAIGSRLASSLVGHNPKDFGRNAKKVVVDIDMEELDKPGIDITLKINNDAKRFLVEMQKQVSSIDISNFSEWITKCNEWKKHYTVVLDSYKDEKPVNSYYFIDKLCNIATKEGHDNG